SVIQLRPYQLDVVERLEQALGATAARVLVVAPTGSGKTVIAAEIINRAVAKYRTVLFLAHRREIIMQTSAKLVAAGVRHGIIMAGSSRDRWSRCRSRASTRCMFVASGRRPCPCRQPIF